MSYSFNPMSEEELNDLAEDGVYNFEVIRSTRKVSKSLNSMAELNIKFWDNKGKIRTLFDYLVFSAVPLNIRKVKHFCDATGLQENYKKGDLPEDLGGYSGKFEVGTQEEQPKDGGGFYPKKNFVKDYVMTDQGAVKVDLIDKSLDDTIPF